MTPIEALREALRLNKLIYGGSFDEPSEWWVNDLVVKFERALAQEQEQEEKPWSST